VVRRIRVEIIRSTGGKPAGHTGGLEKKRPGWTRLRSKIAECPSAGKRGCGKLVPASSEEASKTAVPEIWGRAPPLPCAKHGGADVPRCFAGGHRPAISGNGPRAPARCGRNSQFQVSDSVTRGGIMFPGANVGHGWPNPRRSVFSLDGGDQGTVAHGRAIATTASYAGRPQPVDEGARPFPVRRTSAAHPGAGGAPEKVERTPIRGPERFGPHNPRSSAYPTRRCRPPGKKCSGRGPYLSTGCNESAKSSRTGLHSVKSSWVYMSRRSLGADGKRKRLGDTDRGVQGGPRGRAARPADFSGQRSGADYRPPRVQERARGAGGPRSWGPTAAAKGKGAVARGAGPGAMGPAPPQDRAPSSQKPRYH